MKLLFKTGDVREYSTTVKATDVATFESGTVHQLYSTFALARDAEWCTRLFVLEMKEEDEEGIGTFIHVDHISAAKVGTEITFIGTVDDITQNAVNCSFEARAGDRLLAKGRTGQKILKKEKLARLFDSL